MIENHFPRHDLPPDEQVSYDTAKLARNAKSATIRRASPTNPFPVVYLRCVDAGTDNECWVVCLKGDPGAVQFERS